MSEEVGQNCSNSEFCPISSRGDAPRRHKMSEEMGQICSNSMFCPICKMGAASGRHQMSVEMGQNRSNSEFCPISFSGAAPGRRQSSKEMGQICSNSEFCPIPLYLVIPLLAAARHIISLPLMLQCYSAFFGQFFTHSIHKIHSVPFFRLRELSVTSTSIGQTRLHLPQSTHRSFLHLTRNSAK